MQASFTPVPWCLHTNIYEVNLRQYTPEGTIAAFATHLPRLQAMGVEVLWFMPITPIARQKRLGSLGSYYACASYTQVNPEFGTLEQFKNLVQQAHQLGMRVIIDWVANHTGYGHEWALAHPDWYILDEQGNFTERNGWEDVIDLNYANAQMRQAMIAAMSFWVNEANIDGFRADMAHLVPLDFWEEARTALDQIRPLFWLAECEEPGYHPVFDVSYAWQWMHATEQFIKNGQTVTVLDKVLYGYKDDYPTQAQKLFFTTNHDENSWNGTEYEKYGPAALPFAVFCATWEGVPLLYSGQELPNRKRLKFFDKDQIDWQQPLELEGFYTKLLHLRKTNAALHSAQKKGYTWRLNVSGEQVFCFLRCNGQAQVLVLLNFSNQAIQLSLYDQRVHGSFTDLFHGSRVDFEAGRQIILPAYGYRVLVRA